MKHVTDDTKMIITSYKYNMVDYGVIIHEHLKIFFSEFEL